MSSRVQKLEEELANIQQKLKEAQAAECPWKVGEMVVLHSSWGKGAIRAKIAKIKGKVRQVVLEDPYDRYPYDYDGRCPNASWATLHIETFDAVLHERVFDSADAYAQLQEFRDLGAALSVEQLTEHAAKIRELFVALGGKLP